MIWKSEYLEQICSIIDSNFSVVKKTKYQFTPQGETIIFILSESHFTIHTYPEHDYFSMDIYICNTQTNLNDIIDKIKASILLHSSNLQILSRGNLDLKK